MLNISWADKLKLAFQHLGQFTADSGIYQDWTLKPPYFDSSSVFYVDSPLAALNSWILVIWDLCGHTKQNGVLYSTNQMQILIKDLSSIFKKESRISPLSSKDFVNVYKVIIVICRGSGMYV